MTRTALSTLGVTSLAMALAAGMPISPTAARGHAPPADAGPGAIVASRPALTLDGANLALDAAMAAARDRSAGGAIAVVDDGGHLLAFQRLDGTFPAAASVAIGKARTAAQFRRSTKSFEDAINGGRVALAGVGELTPLQGAVPIVMDGHVVGAIGVSGAHSQTEDEDIAAAGAAIASAGSTTAR